MQTKTPRSRTAVVREDPLENSGLYNVSRPEILALEERHCNNLIVSTRLLRTVGYRIHAIFEESRIVAKILAATDKHFLLLTERDSGIPLRVPQVIEGLRQGGYEWPVTYCVKGKVSPETRSAYKALMVDRVLSLPAATRSSVLDALAWIHERVALKDSGTTILEV